MSKNKHKKEQAQIHNENNEKIKARKMKPWELVVFLLIRMVAVANGAEVTARKVIVKNEDSPTKRK